MNRPYNILRPRAWRRGHRVADSLGCGSLLLPALCIAAVCALAYWQESARAEVAALRIFEVRQIVAAEAPAPAALIACGPNHSEIVCEVSELGGTDQ